MIETITNRPTTTRQEAIKKVEKLLTILRRKGLNISAAYLYGSHAYGIPHPDSDIDVAIISPDLSGDNLDDWCFLNQIAADIDVRMEVVGFRPERFRREHPLAWEVASKGIQIV
jgi:predicted nucleotidyltransferase